MKTPEYKDRLKCFVNEEIITHTPGWADGESTPERINLAKELTNEFNKIIEQEVRNEVESELK